MAAFSPAQERATAAWWNRSHVSSSSSEADTRLADRATQESLMPRHVTARANLCSFATAVLVHHLSCCCVWRFLIAKERMQLVATCQEADGLCLRHVRGQGLPPLPERAAPTWTLARPCSLGRFARGFQLQRRRALDANLAGRLRSLRPVFDRLGAADFEEHVADPAPSSQAEAAILADARRQVQRVDNIYDIVAELSHRLALAELRVQALEAAREDI